LNKPKPKKSGGCVLLWEPEIALSMLTLRFHFVWKEESGDLKINAKCGVVAIFYPFLLFSLKR
jgi:hypothetical protein